ncbi:MAG TPA: hypothetical protein VI756_03830 [Blastocatellia bacterium]
MINLTPVDPSSLVAPRFELFPTIAGAEILDLMLPSSLLSGKAVEGTATSKIISQTGFTSAALQQAFAVGNEIEITYSSIQEYPSANLMELQSTPAPGTFDTQVYVDRLFKTFVIA